MINSVTIAGNVVRDVKFRTVNTDSERKNIMAITLAVNGYNSDDVSFIDVEMWCTENQVCYFEPKLKKGAQIAVQGRIKQNRWDYNGEKKSKVYVEAHDLFIPFVKLGEKKQDAGAEAVYEEARQELYNEDIPF